MSNASALDVRDSKPTKGSSTIGKTAKNIEIEHIQNLIEQCEEQCHMLATSTSDPSLIELRNTIWCWPLSQLPASYDDKDSSCKKLGKNEQKMDEGTYAEECKKCSSLFAESTTPFPNVSKFGLDRITHIGDEDNDDNWLRIPCKADNNDDCGIYFQLVIADLDVAFIRACREYFRLEKEDGSFMHNSGERNNNESSTSIGAKGFGLGYDKNEDRSRLFQRGIRIMHQPMQRAIANSLHEIDKDTESTDFDVHTFVVFGSYGTFPTSQNNIKSGLMTGICKSCIAQLFPTSWDNFAFQCGHHHHCHQHGTTSQVWISSIDEIPNLLTLVACEAYPRNQYPSEEEAAAQRYEMALKKIGERVGFYPSPSSTSLPRLAGVGRQKIIKKRKVRIITHAMGSFVGHLDTGVFAQGLAVAMDRFFCRFNAK